MFFVEFVNGQVEVTVDGQAGLSERGTNAEGGQCDCICGGRNHGAGVRQAVENTRELGEQWLSDIAAREGKTLADLKAELFGQPAGAGLV